MQIRKTYQEVNPELLYNEVRDFVLKQGAAISDSKIETYSLPTDSSSFISRGTLTFKMSGKDCLSAHVLGSARGETKLLLDMMKKSSRQISWLPYRATWILCSARTR